MIGAQIKEGQEYAVNTNPRKGIKDKEALTLLAETIHVRVDRKNQVRYTTLGYERLDGLLVTRLDIGQDAYNNPFIIKARDVLMPWDEYRSIVDAREALRREREAKIAADREQREARVQKLCAILTEEYGLVQGLNSYNSGKGEEFYMDHGLEEIRFTHDGLEKLLSSIGERVYQILAAQE